jgi:hypothetical protein
MIGATFFYGRFTALRPPKMARSVVILFDLMT